MKVAIVHYWLVGMRGGERVLEEICKLYPQADIYTHVVERESLSSHLLQHEIYETFIGKLPFATRHYQKYLPLMPYALENLDLTGYDLVISSEAGPAKGVITSPEALHVCYCHSPMRYIWDQYHEYAKEKGIIQKLTYPILTHKMRIWDAASASRPDHIIANSRFVAQRIKKFWGRGSDVIHPPVDFEAFQDSNNSPDDFYLVAGELVPYKNVGIVIRAFNALQKRLIVIGDGPERSTLEKQAEPNISFLGRVDFEKLRDHYKRCKALIFPGVEDFGIVPLEVMASGRPVIAYARGGALETVVSKETGVFFHEQTPESVQGAIVDFEQEIGKFSSSTIRNHAGKFSQEKFARAFSEFVDDKLKNRNVKAD